MTERDVINGLLVVFLFEVAIALFAFYRICRIYVEENGSKSVLFRIVIRLIGLKVLVAVMFVPVAVNSLLGFPALPLVGVYVTLGVMLLVGAVLIYWRTFELIHAGRVSLTPDELPEPHPTDYD